MLAVVGAADLVALAVIGAGLGGAEPRLDRAAGDGVALHAERGHEPAMDHVAAVGQHADVLVHRHDHLVVDRQQPQLAGLQLVVREDNCC